MSDLNWDDLRLLVAVGRTGSFSGAAHELGLSHSTVSRRMRALESALDVRLFSLIENKLLLTSAGEALYENSLEMAEIAGAGLRQVEGRDTALSGLIRFSTVDATARSLMACLKRFSQLYPQIEIELRVGQQFSSLTRGEADVLLRATNDPPETYVGKCVGHHHFSVCASRELAARFPPDAPLEAFPWVVWGEGMTGAWMEGNIPNANVVFRANTALMMEEAVRAGIGVGHMTSRLLARTDDVVSLRPPDPSLDLEIWLLTHRDLRHAARVRCFIDFLTAELCGPRDVDRVEPIGTG